MENIRESHQQRMHFLDEMYMGEGPLHLRSADGSTREISLRETLGTVAA